MSHVYTFVHVHCVVLGELTACHHCEKKPLKLELVKISVMAYLYVIGIKYMSNLTHLYNYIRALPINSYTKDVMTCLPINPSILRYI